MKHKAPITFVQDDIEFDEPVFTFDKICGFILNALAGIGIFCAVVAGAFFLGYFS